MSSPATPPPPAKSVKSLICPNCGGVVEVRAMQHTRSAVCLQCCTILDTSTPELQIIQKFSERARVVPLIPLGSRGKLHGQLWEVIGFQVRAITVEMIDYTWGEYLLFNPYRGFRYLTEYNGHWNDVITAKGLPTFTSVNGRKAARYYSGTYRHFQTAVARTTFVMGEFPWRVAVGEEVQVDDYVSPPQMLSCETSEGEVNWSVGEYLTGNEVWEAFRLPGQPPPARGVFANQPSPHTGKAAKAWKTFLKLMALWAVLLVVFTAMARNEQAFSADYYYSMSKPGEQSFVTPVFELKGRTSNAEVVISTNLRNNWAFFAMALISEDNGQAFDFGREVSYYSGRDSDGAWSEGRAKDSVVIPRVPPGRYYLRIEPEMDAQASANAAEGTSVRYSVTVLRDVPSLWWLWLALPLIVIPPIVVSIRSASFETQRWGESDYGSSTGSKDSGSEDGDE